MFGLLRKIHGLKLRREVYLNKAKFYRSAFTRRCSIVLRPAGPRHISSWRKFPPVYWDWIWQGTTFDLVSDWSCWDVHALQVRFMHWDWKWQVTATDLNWHAYTYIHHRIHLAVRDMTMNGWKPTISLIHPPTLPCLRLELSVSKIRFIAVLWYMHKFCPFCLGRKFLFYAQHVLLDLI